MAILSLQYFSGKLFGAAGFGLLGQAAKIQVRRFLWLKANLQHGCAMPIRAASKKRGTRWYPAGIAPRGWWLGVESEARRYGPSDLKNGLFSPKTSLHSLTTVDLGLGIGYQWFVADHWAIGLGLAGFYVLEVANPVVDASGKLVQATSLLGTSPSSAFKRIYLYVVPKVTLSVGFVF
ncbi:MAG: hypothetical protein EOO40_08845 [Deltaproteobacteria bacterium]|nr:MAG: hypothetical protein EOO40_08845 [Deltaproteobacteria bacterium]